MIQNGTNHSSAVSEQDSTKVSIPQVVPTGGPLLRHPLRFLRTRSRMMFGNPMSTRWGFDRGYPAHRHYINVFLQEFANDIRGECLEFQDRTYLSTFAGPRVTRQDVLHLDDSNPQATVVADITKSNSIPDNRYDCIICTHVLHMIYELDAAVAGLHRILRDGGVLLVAGPQTSMCDDENELWRFTRLGLHQLLARRFGDENVTTRAYGNSLVAAGEMRGMVADEFTDRELNTHDARYASEVCARAVKVSPKRVGASVLACKCISSVLMFAEPSQAFWAVCCIGV